MDESTHPDDPSRRRLLAGFGAGAAVGLAGAAVALGASPVGAQDAPDAAGGPEGTRAGDHRASPVTSTIASPPEAGVSYVFRSFWDFSPENSTANRAWGGNGVYSTGVESAMWATVEVPAGAVVRDVEWYVYNSSGSTRNCLGRFWTAGTGSLFSTLVDTPIPSGSGTAAHRTIVPASAAGPHPHGTRLTLGMYTPTNGTVQINGVRVGYALGPSSLATLPTPVRVYDSRPGTLPAVGLKARLEANQERVLDLTVNGSKVPAGATAALVTILLTNATAGAGNFTMWRNGTAKPQANTMVWGGNAGRFAITAVTGVDAQGRCRISANLPTHVVIDVVGFYS